MTKSKVNEAGNYTKPAMRRALFNRIKAGNKGGKSGQWSARKAQMLACLLYTSPSPRDKHRSRMPSSA